MRGEYVCIAIQFSISSFLFGHLSNTKNYITSQGTNIWPGKEYTSPIGISTNFLKFVHNLDVNSCIHIT